MAKVIYGDQGTLEGNPYPGALDLDINDKKTRGVYTDDESSATISFFGEKLKAAGEDDNYFSSGNIDKIVFKDGDSDTILTITGNYKAANLSSAFQDGGVEGLTLALFAGKDKIEGGNGNDQIHGYAGNDAIDGGKGSDYIYGDLGNDELKGGKGVDYFVFNSVSVEGGNGDDVITDFDVIGNQTDYLWAESSYEFQGANKGHDTLLTFTDGSTVLLEDVKKADFQHYLDNMPTI